MSLNNLAVALNHWVRKELRLEDGVEEQKQTWQELFQAVKPWTHNLKKALTQTGITLTTEEETDLMGFLVKQDLEQWKLEVWKTVLQNRIVSLTEVAKEVEIQTRTPARKPETSEKSRIESTFRLDEADFDVEERKDSTKGFTMKKPAVKFLCRKQGRVY